MQGMSHGDGVDEDKMMKHDLGGKERWMKGYGVKDRLF